MEAELRKLMTEIQALNDRLQATEGFPAERKRLEVAVELKEMEKNQLAEVRFGNNRHLAQLTFVMSIRFLLLFCPCILTEIPRASKRERAGLYSTFGDGGEIIP